MVSNWFIINCFLNKSYTEANGSDGNEDTVIAGSQMFQWLSSYCFCGDPDVSLWHPKPLRSAF